MGTERIRNGYGTDKEREWEREQECMWYGIRTRSVKHSLLGFFCSLLYCLISDDIPGQ